MTFRGCRPATTLLLQAVEACILYPSLWTHLQWNDAQDGRVAASVCTERLHYLFRRYASNTRVKFILVVDEVMPKDEEMRLVSLAFHAVHLKL